MFLSDTYCGKLVLPKTEILTCHCLASKAFSGLIFILQIKEFWLLLCIWNFRQWVSLTMSSIFLLNIASLQSWWMPSVHQLWLPPHPPPVYSTPAVKTFSRSCKTWSFHAPSKVANSLDNDHPSLVDTIYPLQSRNSLKF